VTETFGKSWVPPNPLVFQDSGNDVASPSVEVVHIRVLIDDEQQNDDKYDFQSRSDEWLRLVMWI
jgi:hypothetical protein